MKSTFKQPFTDIFMQLVANISSFSGDDAENIIEWFTDFEYTTKALGWTDKEKFAAVPLYLKGTAKLWYNVISKTTITTNDCPKDYISLKNRMIEDFCPYDYTSYLCRKLQEAEQQIGQSSISFIYEMYELCLRIHEQTPEIFIVSLIKEKLLPQIKYGVELQNPKTIKQLVTTARLAERAMYSCFNPFDTSNEAIDQLKVNIQRMEKRLDSFVNRKINRLTRPCSIHYDDNQTEALQLQYVPNFNEIMIQSGENSQSSPSIDNQTYNNYNVALDYYPSVNCITTDPGSFFSNPKADSIHKREEKRTGLQTDTSTLSLPTKIHANADNKRHDRDKVVKRNKEASNVIKLKEKVLLNLIQKPVEINNIEVDTILDTGSEVSLISKELAEYLNLQIHNYIGSLPISVDNRSLPVLGKVKVKIKIADDKKVVDKNTCVLVIEKLPNGTQSLIGQDLLSQFHVNIDCRNKSINLL